ISPSGRQVVFEARGDLFTVPLEPGPAFDITRTSGAAERFPSWSPDGTTIAYWSDRTGEYELTVRRADGAGDERTVTRLGPGFRYRIFWSPDSTRVAFVDQAMNIELCDIASGAVTRMDQALYLYESSLERFAVSWSPDSRWVAYRRPLPNRRSAIFLYDTRDRKLAQATSGFCDDFSPVFDPEGRFLYYGSQRSFLPSIGTDDSWIFANTDKLVAVPLRRDVRSPLALDSGEEGGGSAASAGRTAAMGIDLEGFEDRAVILPPRERYTDLQALPGKLFYRRLPRTGSGEQDTALVFYDLAERGERTVLDDVDSYEIAANGGKILAGKKTAFAVVEPKPGQKMDRPLPTSELEMLVEPLAEWRQIFADAWRFERDVFYDPHMHGVDWPEMRKRYGALLEGCVTRFDVNDLLGEMLGELNSSHAYRSGGDLETVERLSLIHISEP
ncbi:MAG: peptidase S41, partial [Candidatus Eisenbacteria bacterium]|nr:peptidase S41 [Candidatus Eisenbacteria bacterium]